MNNIHIFSTNIYRFARYSYIIMKRMKINRLNFNKILFGYIIHLKFLIRYKLYKQYCDFHISPNVVVVVDNNVNVVYRFSLNDYGSQSVNNNYNFLLKYNKKLEIPKPISINYNSMINIAVSSETNINSKELHTDTINTTLITEVFSQLKQFYETHLNISLSSIKSIVNEYDYLYIYYHQNWIDKLVKFKNIIHAKLSMITDNREIKSVLTIIHGDLTFRNILKNNNITFIDFDRSDLNYPEYDYFLFNIDLYTYKQFHKPTYEQFFDNLLMFTKNDKFMTNEIDKFYELNSKFYENKKILHIIKYFLLYRTLVFTLLNFRFNETTPVVILDKCLKSIESYEK